MTVCEDSHRQSITRHLSVRENKVDFRRLATLAAPPLFSPRQVIARFNVVPQLSEMLPTASKHYEYIHFVLRHNTDHY